MRTLVNSIMHLQLQKELPFSIAINTNTRKNSNELLKNMTNNLFTYALNGKWGYNNPYPLNCTLS